MRPKPLHKDLIIKRFKKKSIVKKKQCTHKNTLISGLNRWIYFVGKTISGGKTHDFQLLKNEFPPAQNWFGKFRIWVDSGYQGFAKNYQTKDLKIPIKKPKKSKKNPITALSEAQKNYNRSVSQVRVVVENAIARMKRYNILNYKFRNKNLEFADDVIALCAGLANLKIKYKNT